MRLMKSDESLVRRTSGDVAEETHMKHSAQAFLTPHTLSEQSWKKRGSCTGRESSAGKEKQKTKQNISGDLIFYDYMAGLGKDSKSHMRISAQQTIKRDGAQPCPVVQIQDVSHRSKVPLNVICLPLFACLVHAA